jgi:N-methylhydantoinase B/oxoprolinase/acetone carboxylase alpha subunit
MKPDIKDQEVREMLEFYLAKKVDFIFSKYQREIDEKIDEYIHAKFKEYVEKNHGKTNEIFKEKIKSLSVDDLLDRFYFDLDDIDSDTLRDVIVELVKRSL